MIQLSPRGPVCGLRVACKFGIGAVVVLVGVCGSYRQAAASGQHRHVLVLVASVEVTDRLHLPANIAVK